MMENMILSLIDLKLFNLKNNEVVGVVEEIFGI